jgi:hypothetical protein
MTVIKGIGAQAASFVSRVAELRFDDTFNPYADLCPDYDDFNANATRRKNLQLVLQAALRCDVESLWLGRDLGYRGGRRTGLALTDEVHLQWHEDLMRTGPLVRATKGPVVSERTASVVWRALRAIDRPIFLWNIFPLHPHAPGDPMSNRPHTRAEADECLPLLSWLLERLNPRRVVAIGREAQSALARVGVAASLVRHPSYGGQTEFGEGIAQLYGLPLRLLTQSPLQRQLT